MSRIPVSLDPFLPRALNQRWEGELEGHDLPRVRAAALEGAPISVRIGLSVVRGALGEIVFDGIKSNIPLHIDLMNDSHFQNGGTNIHYLEKKLKGGL
jgi:hypothetical protein